MLWCRFFFNFADITILFRCTVKTNQMRIKESLLLLSLLLILASCSKDDGNPTSGEVTVSIEATGLSDDKLALNNSAIFTASISGFEGEVTSLSYKWTLSNENGQLSDGINSLANPTIAGSSINCIGTTAGEEVITVEVMDDLNTIVAITSYSFTILSPGGSSGSYGCFDQPKFIYRNGPFHYVMNLDGTNQEYLGVGGGVALNISPDGEWIAHGLQTITGYQMNVFRCDGSTGLIPIEFTAGYWWGGDNHPIFSLDSGTLYFTRPVEAEGNPDFESGDDIFSYDLETGALNNLTNIVQQGEFVLGGLTISPMSGDIAFQRYNPNTAVAKLAFLQPESGLITDFYTFPDGYYATTLDWSPDGGDIIFPATFPTGVGIYRINLTSGSQPLLVYQNTSLPFDVFPGSPTYYNNGNRIAWTGPALLNGTGQSGRSMFSIDANGEDLQLLLDANSSLLELYGILR